MSDEAPPALSLPATIVLVRVAEPPLLYRPPPSPPWLPLMVPFVRHNLPTFSSPPPASAELPLTVQLVSVAVPLLSSPPPEPAELPLTVQLVSVAVPPLYRPPPLLPPSLVVVLP